jgi:hypothetical protein
VASFSRTVQGLGNFKVVTVLVNCVVRKLVQVMTTFFTRRSTTLLTTWATIFFTISVARDGGFYSRHP